VGGLAHFFEEEGLPTTQISLIREHTETIKPPRALWVSFELGRPLGVPNDAAFQTRVVLAALNLLEVPSGPVIEDFPEDSPVAEDVQTPWSCPVDLTPEMDDLSDSEQLGEALKGEMGRLRPWYDMALNRRLRTTVGVSELDIDTIGDFVGSFIKGDIPENPREDLPLGFTLKLALDDLKAYYTEAATAQPGGTSPGSQALLDWFWDETVASKVLFAIKDMCMKSRDEVLKLVGKMLIVPMAKARVNP
jgi:hypothetical protein